ncbi:hypothetical protein IT575_12205 [bacterium]|nr:hypothetical protein [bacterium]
MPSNPKVSLTLTLENGQFKLGLKEVQSDLHATKQDSKAMAQAMSESARAAETSYKQARAAYLAAKVAGQENEAQLKKEAAAARLAAQAAKANMEAFKATSNEARKLGDSADQAGRKGASGLKQMHTQASQLKTTLGEVQQILRGLSVLAAGGLGTMAVGGGYLATRGIRESMTFEDIRAGYEAQLKDRAAAQKLFNETLRFTKYTPFRLQQTAEGSGMILDALGSQSASNGQLMSMLNIVGQAVAAKPGKLTLDQAIRALTQLRGGSYQLQEMLPLGLTREVLEKNGVGFDSQNQLTTSGPKAFEIALKVLQEKYDGFFDQAENRLSTMLSNLEDSVQQKFAAFGDILAESGVKDFFKEVQAELDKLDSDPGFLKGIRELGREAGQMVKGAGSQLIQFLRDGVEWLGKHPTALADALRTATEVAKGLFVAVVILTGLSGLVALAEGITIILGLFAGPAGWVVLIGLAVAAIMGGNGLLNAINQLTGSRDDMTQLGRDSAAAMQIMREEFRKTEGGARSLIVALLDLAMAQQDNARTMRQREALNELGLNSWRTNGRLTVNVGSPQGPKKTIDLGNSIERAEAFASGAPTLYFDGMPITSVAQNPSGNWGMSATEALGTQISRAKQADPGPVPMGPWRPPGPYLNSQYNPGKAAWPFGSDAADALPEDKRGPFQIELERRQVEVRAQLKKLTYGDGKGLICVLKTGKGMAVLGGADAEAWMKSVGWDASTSSTLGKVQSSGLSRAGLEDLQPGDMVFHVKPGGKGHTGLFDRIENGKVYITGNSPGSVGYDIPLSEFMNPAIAYKPGQTGAYAFVNPFDSVRQWQGQLGGLTGAPLGSWSSPHSIPTPYGPGASPADKVNAMLKAVAGDTSSRYSAEYRVEKLQEQVTWYQKLGEAMGSFVDGLKQKVQELQGLKDSLVDARDGLAVSIQQALGFDRGADVLRAQQLERSARDARDAYGKLGPDASPEEQARAMQRWAEGVKAMYDMAAGLRGRKGAEQLVGGLISNAGELGKGLPENLDAVIRTLDEKLSDASYRLTTAGDRLKEAADNLKTAAFALMNKQQQMEQLRLEHLQGINPGAPITGGGLPSSIPNGGASKYAPAPTSSAGADSTAVGTARTMPSDWSAPGWTQVSCNGDGTCNFEYTGDGGSSYGAGGTYPEDSKGDKKSGVNAAQAGLQKFAGVLQSITAIVQSAGQSLGAKISAIGGLVGQFNPGLGSVISAAGGLWDAVSNMFGGGNKRLKADVRPEEGSSWLVHFASLQNYGLEANPSGRLTAGQGVQSGTGGEVVHRHEHEFIGDLANLVRTATQTSARREQWSYSNA